MRQLMLAAIALLTGVLNIRPGPYGHPAGATGVHARRTTTLQEAVGRRQRGSAMFAAKPHEAEPELPEGISEPRNVTKTAWRPRRFCDPYPSCFAHTIA
jgi:hypothetical protein